MSETREKGCGAGRADLRLVLLGGRNSGKSSAGNTILRRSLFEIDKMNSGCRVGQEKVAGKKVTVVDTPGWDYFTAAIPQEIKQEMERSVSLCSPGPHAFLLTIPVGSDVILPRLKEHMHLLGDIVWRYTLVLFTCGDRLAGSTLKEYIESKGGVLQRLLEKCENRYHVLNNLNMGDETQVTELLKKVEHMRSNHYECYIREKWRHVEPDVQPEQELQLSQQWTEPDEREEQNWCNRDQGQEQIQSDRDQVQNTTNGGKAPRSKGTTEISPPPTLNRSRETLAEEGGPRESQQEEGDISGPSLEAGALQAEWDVEQGRPLKEREDERKAGMRGAQAEREEPRGRVEREKEAHLMPPQVPNVCTSSTSARYTQVLQQLGEMAVQLGEVTETLRLMYEEQAREEAERHRDAAPQINAYRVQSAAAAAAQELTAALTERDQERDKLQAEIVRLRESTEEKDREMERLRESCVQKDAEIERLKEEVAEVRRRFEETSREVEKNKRVLQQLQALVALVNAPAERE
ncbi:RNA-binding protein 25-like isoform X2 [Anguilla anguilla]|uniref:RNA-binding protein 25-like isoform X2 n=1 Tax=Anguilla anguilla TaxID=7936 RepID=UPI0015AE7E95|nr:RNA-binding protein 25-like isoform X2 [Anguilla anguilla]